jgi:serine/threonine protein kinase
MPKLQRFGSYVLLKKVASGGMAELYKAKKSGEKGFEKLLAIKMILPHLAENDEFISMFIDEAKVAAILNHQNIVQIYDLGKIEDSYCIVMEYVRGKDLRSVLSRGGKAGPHVGVEHACLITASALSGLSYAHRKRDKGRDIGIVHRDISPQNIIVSYEGEVKIVDFGIAKAATKSSETRTGVLKGKLAYMSPEQARGKPLDARSDIFSMGVVLYEMLTGQRLFQGDTDLDTLERVRDARVEPLPTELKDDVPKELEDILLKSLSREPEGRFQSASEMEEALQGFMRKAGYSTNSYSLSQYMFRLFKEEIEEELREEEEWDQTMVTAPPSDDTIASPASPAPKPAPAGPAQAGPSQLEAKKAGYPLKDKVLVALIVVVALGVGGAWLKFRDRGGQPAPSAAAVPATTENTSNKDEAAQPKPETPAAPRAAAPVKPERSQKSAPPAPPAPASVAIESEPPGAEVYINNRRSGTTPLDLDGLPANRHNAVRVVKEGYEPWTGGFNAVPGKTDRVFATLKKAAFAVQVNSQPPGARVYIDGQDTGKTTPASVEGLEPGRAHSVKVELDGYARYEGTFTQSGTAPARVSAALTQLFGRLTVDSKPWAIVFVDGEKRGMTPLADMKLGAGQHELVMDNPKLQAKKRVQVRVEPNKTTRIMVDLNKPD